MAYKLKIPFYSIEISFLEDSKLQVPMYEHDVVHIASTSTQLARQFEKAFQEKVIDKGDYIALLEQYQTADYSKNKVKISFKAAKDRLTYPNFELAFDYYFKDKDGHFWGVIPVLGLEAFGKDADTLYNNLAEAVKLEFARKKRLKSLRLVIETQWYDSSEIKEKEVSFAFHTPSELEKLHDKKKSELLPKVAERLNINKKIAFGRQKQVEQLANILKGKFTKSVLIVGASGVGKTSLVWELAYQKNKLNVKQNIYETTASTLIKELTKDTGWQDNLAYLCRELSAKGDVLYVRNMLELFEVGQYEGNSVSMALYLRSYLSRGEITIISECTDEEFAKIELKSPNYLAHFQVIRLEEPKELEDVIIQKVESIAKGQNLSVDQEAVRETLRLNKRYMPYSGFPGKPVQFLEGILLNHFTKEKENTEGEKRLDKQLVFEQFSQEAGMPRFMIDPNVPMKLEEVQKHFSSNIFGQEKAVNSVVDLLATVKTALARQGKPIASFLFVGPTGVGKTEMAKVLAEFMFGSRDRMIRFDMSEYSSPHQVMRLTGMSYFQDGILTSAVRQTPFSVLLFDEIEKASPLFYDLLLQLLSEGRLTDSSGRLVNFCSTIIIMTSNIGAANLQTGRVGWSNELDVKAISEHFESAVRKHFRPELFNRIDEVIPFEPINKSVIRYVVNREIALFRKREGVKARDLDLKISEEVLDFVGQKGYDPKYGARQIQRAIRELIVIPMSTRLNDFAFDEKLEVHLTMKDGAIDFNVEMDPLKFDLLMEELTRNEFADHAGSLRRSIRMLQEGNFFIQLTSELDMLEQKRRKIGDKKFWKSKKGQQYSYYLATKDKVEQMALQIESHEEELMMVGMGLQSYNTRIIDDIKAWEKSYFDIKVELFTRINQQSDSCRLAIYGKDLEQIIDIYFEIFKKKDFIAAASSLWFRESHFNEVIETIENVKDDSGETVAKITKNKPRHEYVSKAFDFENKEKSLTPEKNGDVFVGIEVDLFGQCPYLYFSEEDGFHRLKLEGQKQNTYHIICSENIKVKSTPLDIHRKKHFERKNTRRVFSDVHIKDNLYKINREITRSNLAEMLITAMNERFNYKLDSVLV
jgi:ATP-dependent Clp protease ATP-binding subunit ClpA